MRDREGEAGWERGWDGHQVEQLRRLARLPFIDKLEWLEKAHAFVRHLSSHARGVKDGIVREPAKRPE